MTLFLFYRCSQHNQSSLLDENKSSDTENCCQHCLTPWKHGNFFLKTVPIRENKNDKLRKKQPTKLFNMVIVEMNKINNYNFHIHINLLNTYFRL